MRKSSKNVEKKLRKNWRKKIVEKKLKKISEKIEEKKVEIKLNTKIEEEKLRKSCFASWDLNFSVVFEPNSKFHSPQKRVCTKTILECFKIIYIQIIFFIKKVYSFIMVEGGMIQK